MLLRTGHKLTAVRSLVERCGYVAASPFPFPSRPELRTVAGGNSRLSAAAVTPRCDPSWGAQTEGNVPAVWRPRERLLLDGAAPENGVQLERTLLPFSSSYPAPRLPSLSDSPHHTCSAPPVKKLPGLPPVVVDPALLEVNTRTPERRPSGWSQTVPVPVLHHEGGFRLRLAVSGLRVSG